MCLHLPQRKGQKHMGNHSPTAGMPSYTHRCFILSEPTARALVWGKKTAEAAVVPSYFHPSPAQANVLMTGVTSCNAVGQVIISVIGINSSRTHKVISFTVGKTVLG